MRSSGSGQHCSCVPRKRFALTGLEKLTYIIGRSYKKLPPKLRRGLDRASLSAIVLLHETRSDQSHPYLVHRLVFERLNTGGRPLNPQEIRNSIFRGQNLFIARVRHPGVAVADGRGKEFDEAAAGALALGADSRRQRLKASTDQCRRRLLFHRSARSCDGLDTHQEIAPA